MRIIKALINTVKAIKYMRSNKALTDQMEQELEAHDIKFLVATNIMADVFALKASTGIGTKLIFEGETPVVIVKATRSTLAKVGTLYSVQYKVDRTAFDAEKRGCIVRLAKTEEETV